MWVSRKRIEAVEEELARVSATLRKITDAISDRERTWDGTLKTFEALTDEIDSRIERGNQIWRQVRARERREEKLEEPEGDPEGDARGGETEGVPALRTGVAADTIHPVEAARRALALAIANNPHL